MQKSKGIFRYERYALRKLRRYGRYALVSWLTCYPKLAVSRLLGSSGFHVPKKKFTILISRTSHLALHFTSCELNSFFIVLPRP